MRKWILTSLILIFGVNVFGATAYNGTVTKDAKGKFIIYKVIFGSSMTDDETFTFPFDGVVRQISFSGNATDADGTITATDISGINYLPASWTPLSASATGRYVIPSLDSSSNVYGGAIVSGTSTFRLVNMAGAKPLTMYIYCKAD
jgi:hypothetical protein